MTAPTLPHDPDELAQLRAEVAALRGELRGQARPAAPRARRLPRRLLPLALVTLLLALTPLGLLAANPFTDLTGGVHDPNIDAIYTAGITTGCGPTSYCPTDTVTRQEMASFLARTAGLGTNPPVANAKTAQTATNAASAGNAAQLGGIAAANYVQTNNPALPIAYATVSSAGTKLTGSSNVSVIKSATGKYTVTIAGEAFFYTSYATSATILGNPGVIDIDSVGGKMIVETYNVAGTATDQTFAIVVFKP